MTKCIYCNKPCEIVGMDRWHRECAARVRDSGITPPTQTFWAEVAVFSIGLLIMAGVLLLLFVAMKAAGWCG